MRGEIKLGGYKMNTDEVFTREDVQAPEPGGDAGFGDNWLVKIEHIIDGVNLLLSQAINLRSGGGPGSPSAVPHAGAAGLSSPPTRDRSGAADGMYAQLLGLLHQFEGKGLTVDDLKQELIKRRPEVVQLLEVYLQSF